MHELVTIRAGAIEAAVAPAAGGRLAQLTVADTHVLIGHSTDAADTGWGCYPMVPWPGRIRRGRFDFDGVEHQLPINFGAHAIHGVGFTSSWSIDTRSADSVTLGLELPSDGSWPFGGAVTQRFEVDDRGLTVSMTVAADRRAMPAAFGWHPWFVKPDSMAFAPTAMYRRDDDHIALDELVDVPTGPWDDCFVNTEPVEITIGPARLRLSSNCDHWVVYDEPGHATCIEPQTAPPDAFNIAPHRLAPGETLSAWFRIDVLAESLPNTTEFV